MDISDSFDPQQQQQQQQVTAAGAAEQQMQCDPAYPTSVPTLASMSMPMSALTPTSCNAPLAATTNGFSTALVPMHSTASPFGPVGHAIPLPAPPHLKTSAPQPQQQPYGPLQQPTTDIEIDTMQSQPQPQQQSNADIEIDSLLLQQFSCLGTTDHEDLVKQFQSLMNNQVDREAARFYLEMSNWNLQTAVGCYLDFYTFQTLPSMKIVQQSRPSEYQQVWRLQNDGTVDWPNGCYLSSPSQKRRIEVPALKPGETCDIVAEIPPSQPAIMWRLCTPNGWNVGEPIWMVPNGMADTQAELSERMSQLLMTSDATNPESCPQVHVVISVNME